jgi:DNA (cytosine-5)-methyltransferase 1
LQDREKAKKMTATSGRTSSKLLHPKDPLGAFSKTFMGTSHWDSTLSSLTWNVKATPQGRLLFQLAVSTPRIKETESGLLPTPTTQDNPQVKGNPDHPKRGTTLGGYARMYPTPTASDYKNMDTANQQSQLAKVVRMYPTPRASEYKDCGPVGSKSHTHMKDRKYLCATVKEEDKPSGMLNPTWVEWLMGYPKEWTELKD